MKMIESNVRAGPHYVDFEFLVEHLQCTDLPSVATVWRLRNSDPMPEAGRVGECLDAASATSAAESCGEGAPGK